MGSISHSMLLLLGGNLEAWQPRTPPAESAGWGPCGVPRSPGRLTSPRGGWLLFASSVLARVGRVDGNHNPVAIPTQPLGSWNINVSLRSNLQTFCPASKPAHAQAVPSPRHRDAFILLSRTVGLMTKPSVIAHPARATGATEATGSPSFAVAHVRAQTAASSSREHWQSRVPAHMWSPPRVQTHQGSYPLGPEMPSTGQKVPLARGHHHCHPRASHQLPSSPNGVALPKAFCHHLQLQ